MNFPPLAVSLGVLFDLIFRDIIPPSSFSALSLSRTPTSNDRRHASYSIRCREEEERAKEEDPKEEEPDEGYEAEDDED